MESSVGVQVLSWLKKLGVCLDAATASDGDLTTLRNVLFGLYMLLQNGGLKVQNAFKNLSEGDLGGQARELGEQLTQGEYDRPPNPTDLASGVRLAGALLRAAEQAVLSLGEHGRAPRRSKDLSVSFAGERGWLVPFPPKFRGEPSDWPPYFAKRALKRSRCLAQVLPSGHKIDLQLFDAEVGVELVGAACLFDQLQLIGQDGHPITHETVGSFVVTGLTGRPAGSLETSLQYACDPSAKAGVVVFPELSITTVEQAEIQRLLRTTPWAKEITGHRPALVVGGSWHEQQSNNRYQNRAPVFDGRGKRLGYHAKHTVYGAKAPTGILKEDIDPGADILVLVSRSLTAAIAICLDFCQLGEDNAYDDLDVDVVLVASLADKKTAVDHGTQADRIWKRRKAGTFLAQQNDAGPGGFTGANPSPDGVFVAESAPSVVIRRISPQPLTKP